MKQIYFFVFVVSIYFVSTISCSIIPVTTLSQDSNENENNVLIDSKKPESVIESDAPVFYKEKASGKN